MDRWREPWWHDYRPLLDRLGSPHTAGTERLNELLPPGAASGGGKPLRFVPAAELPGVGYEQRIFATGQVSTRANNWHDRFNALAWCRLPRLKAAMNALHYAHLDEEAAGRRGPRRDALTLLDESGAVVISRDRALLEALRLRDWRRAFVELRQAWVADTRTVICGHALLEKLLRPYKSITAHVLLMYIDSSPESLDTDGLLARLDETLAARLREGLCRSPAELSPLPLMGIPGWWPEGAQDSAFYADRTVFRLPPRVFLPAPIHSGQTGQLPSHLDP